MRHHDVILCVLGLAVVSAALTGCSGSSNATDADAGSDAVIDGGVDSRAEAGGDTEADPGTGADTDIRNDTGTNIVTGTCTVSGAVSDDGVACTVQAYSNPDTGSYVLITGGAGLIDVTVNSSSTWQADTAYTFGNTSAATSAAVTSGGAQWEALAPSTGDLTMTLTSVHQVGNGATVIQYVVHGTLSATLLPLVGSTSNVTLTADF